MTLWFLSTFRASSVTRSASLPTCSARSSAAPTCAAPSCEKKAVSKTKRLCAEHGGGRRCVAPGCQKIAKTELATCLMHAEAAPSETQA